MDGALGRFSWVLFLTSSFYLLTSLHHRSRLHDFLEDHFRFKEGV